MQGPNKIENLDLLCSLAAPSPVRYIDTTCSHERPSTAGTASYARALKRLVLLRATHRCGHPTPSRRGRSKVGGGGRLRRKQQRAERRQANDQSHNHAQQRRVHHLQCRYGAHQITARQTGARRDMTCNVTCPGAQHAAASGHRLINVLKSNGCGSVQIWEQPDLEWETHLFEAGSERRREFSCCPPHGHQQAGKAILPDRRPRCRW